ncbi:hypothetical protein FA13DRAFT_1740078 [Coprinellus micaceus]|uniref:Uncharacterized protein n=1 Tax=Coprinellus micaceus TaxID=71717 RepID=A0A4Y7SQ02_COPMI|nr:hypothetical protein FA13DRAFT_1740078 [Coprinellus micaceus]
MKYSSSRRTISSFHLDSGSGSRFLAAMLLPLSLAFGKRSNSVGDRGPSILLRRGFSLNSGLGDVSTVVSCLRRGRKVG